MKLKRVIAVAATSVLLLTGVSAAPAVEDPVGTVEDLPDDLIRALYDALGLLPGEIGDLLGLDPRSALPVQPAPDREAQTTHPPEPGSDPSAPSTRVRTAQQDFDRARDDGTIPPPILDPAYTHFLAAIHEWRGADPAGVSPRSVIASLGDASEALDHREAPPQALVLQRHLGAIATSIAERIVAAYDRAGADDETKRAQMAAADHGKALIAADGVTPGIDAFDAIFQGAPQIAFDMDAFEQNIRNAFDPNTVGYAYAIAKDGLANRFGQNGQARTSSDSPAANQNVFKEMNIASVSKTMTAVAVLRLLDQNGLFLDSPIDPWIPEWWTRGPGVENLTFRRLMTHTSGLNGNNGALPYDYQGLQSAIAGGVDAPQTFQYQNANFSLFRVMIPRLAGTISDGDTVGSANARSAADTIATISAYQDYMQDEVFGPMGITAACTPSDNSPTMFYNPNVAGAGLQAGNWSAICGSGGWYMSAFEVAAFMAHMRYNDAILSPAYRLFMNINFTGWMAPADYPWGDGDWGVYHNHGGDLRWDSNLPGNQRRGMDSCVMSFPNGVQIAMLINSQGVGYPGLPASGYQCAAIQAAFDGAWGII